MSCHKKPVDQLTIARHCCSAPAWVLQ